jgi:SAM-dependent methyltransferase
MAQRSWPPMIKSYVALAPLLLWHRQHKDKIMEKMKWHPGKLLEVSGSYWQTATLHAGLMLDVFTAIGNQQVTGSQVARKIDSDVRATLMLLNGLTAMGLLSKDGDRFANTKASAAFLAADSPRYMGHILKHHYFLVDSWRQLDRAVKTGSAVRDSATKRGDAYRESFLMGMFDLAMGIAPNLTQQIDLSAKSHLLDLGGGPGTYAIHFCLNNLHLKATVFDLPTTRPFALKTIGKFGVADRIDFMAGDYLKDEIHGKYDVAWLSHILHGEGPKACVAILRKTVSVLKPGGLILIHDFILNDTLDAPLFPALFALNMLLGTPSGQSYSQAQLSAMLEEAGCINIQRFPFQGPNDSGIISAVV